MWIPITLIVAVLLFIVFLDRYRTYKKFWRHIMEIPGPKGYPIIGNLFDLIGDGESTFRKDRERAKQYYPIYKLWALDKVATCILAPEDMELVLTNMKHNTKSHLYHFLESWLGSGLLTSSGPKWQYRRKLLTPAFHFSILQEFVNTFNKETERLVETITNEHDKSYIDVVKPVTEYTLASIGETSLGVDLNKEKSSDAYKEALYKFGENQAYRSVRVWLHDAFVYNMTKLKRENTKLISILHKFSNGIVQERKRTFKVDATNVTSYTTKKRLAMLDSLLTAQYNGADINDESIREEVDTFMFEGHDTTSMAICYALMALANEESVQQRILEELHDIFGESDRNPTYNDLMEMKYMERCIKEALRLYPSVPFIARLAGEDIKTSTGYTIPKGSYINIHIYDLHRNPRIWENPDKFDPDRFLPENVATRHPFAYIPFSAGPRNCIGQRYAILEIKAALCGVLRKFKLKPVDTPLSCRFKLELVLRTIHELKVKFVPRQ